SETPVFVSDASVERYGPGHNSFTTTPEGDVVHVYHARTYTEIEGDPLRDPNRHACAQLLPFDEDGRPLWGTPAPGTRPAPTGREILAPSGEKACARPRRARSTEPPPPAPGPAPPSSRRTGSTPTPPPSSTTPAFVPSTPSPCAPPYGGCSPSPPSAAGGGGGGWGRTRGVRPPRCMLHT